MFRSSLVCASRQVFARKYQRIVSDESSLSLYSRRYSQSVDQSHLKSTVVTSLPRNCPSCLNPLPTALAVCPKCYFVARLHPSISYHDLFGLPYEPNPFVIDTAALKRRFHDAQRICHPDVWATRDEDSKSAALEISNLVNTSYRTLLSPLSRVEYVLRRNDIEIEETDQLDDIELISEIMEAREEIDAIEPHQKDRLSVLREENLAKLGSVIRDIESYVESKNWGDTKLAAIRLRYFEGIERAIKRKLDGM